MRTHSRRIWPAFLAVAVLGVLGGVVLEGVAGGVVCFVAWLALIGASIYALAGEKVQDGCGGIAGGTGF